MKKQYIFLGVVAVAAVLVFVAFSQNAFNLKGQVLVDNQASVRISVSPDTPTGNQGAVADNQRMVLRFMVENTSKDMVKLKSIRISFYGDAEFGDFQLFGPSNNYTSAIATSDDVMRSAPVGMGDQAGQHHVTNGMVTFGDLVGSDTEIFGNMSNTYIIRANAYALTSNDNPIRFAYMRPFINSNDFATPDVNVLYSNECMQVPWPDYIFAPMTFVGSTYLE